MTDKELIKELFDSVAELAGLVDVAFEYESDVFGIVHNDAVDAVIKAEKLLKKVKQNE